MAQLIDIRKVTVGPKYLTACIGIAEDGPLTTNENPEGTALVLGKLPQIRDHVCLGDAGETFGDSAESTEVAHLFEHVAIELMARTGLAGDISSGRTRALSEERCYEVELACPDDVLTVGALSSAAFILDWAYSGGGEPEPGVDAIVNGLIEIVESAPLPEPEPEPAAEPEPEPEPAAEPEPEPEPAEDETPESKAEPESESAANETPEPASTQDVPERVDPGSTVMMSADQISEAASAASAPESAPEPATEPEPAPASELAPEPAAQADEPRSSVPQPIFTAGPSAGGK